MKKHIPQSKEPKCPAGHGGHRHAALRQADQLLAKDFFLRHFSHRLGRRYLEMLKKFLTHPSIRQRRFAFENPDCLVEEDPDRRIERFTHWAVDLSARASLAALARVGARAPGGRGPDRAYLHRLPLPRADQLPPRRLGLDRDIRTYDLVGIGCGGAVPTLQAGAEHLQATARAWPSALSVEICSATFQMEGDLGLLMSNALFADGAAAALLWTRPRGVGAGGLRQSPPARGPGGHPLRLSKWAALQPAVRTLPQIVNGAVATAVQKVLEPGA